MSLGAHSALCRKTTFSGVINWPQKLMYGVFLPFYAYNHWGDKIISATRYIRIVELSSSLIKDSPIPLFSLKFSKRDLCPVPVTYSPSSERVSGWRLPGYGRALPRLWTLLERKSISMKYLISRQSISSVNGFDPWYSPGGPQRDQTPD